MASIEYSQVRKGMVIVGDDGQLYSVVDRDLNTPGNWRAILQLKLKNLKTGSITINRVRPQDKVEQAYLDKREMQYLYKDGDSYVFMDTEPSMKGATAQAQYKPATLETGLKITVPPFIGLGDMIAVDTRTGEYLSRSK